MNNPTEDQPAPGEKTPLEIKIEHNATHVTLSLNVGVKNLLFTPSQALDIAQVLIAGAKGVMDKDSLIVTPHGHG